MDDLLRLAQIAFFLNESFSDWNIFSVAIYIYLQYIGARARARCCSGKERDIDRYARYDIKSQEKKIYKTHDG